MDEKKVRTVAFRTATSIRYGDLIFIAGQPHLVWEWEDNHPRATTALDPNHLETQLGRVPPGADAVYGQEVEDPRKLQ